MSERNQLVVAGFSFNSEEDAEAARQEVQKIEYLDKRMNYKMPENLLAVYNKMLETKLIQTPVGWDYLRKMQLRMVEAGIEAEQIPPIPLYGVFTHKMESTPYSGITSQRIRPSLKKEKTTEEKYRTRFYQSAIIGAALFCVIIGMFFIALSSDQPNILNYEKALLDRYAAWEQELSGREAAVRDKELELLQEDQSY